MRTTFWSVAHTRSRCEKKLDQHYTSFILAVLQAGLEIRLVPETGAAWAWVKIKSGDLAGVEGWLEKRFGSETGLLRLDFSWQTAAVKLRASELELI